MKIFLCLLLGVILINPAMVVSGEGNNSPDENDFNQYWYSGKAELTRYELKQARYGEIRKGDAVLIFVTEDFLTDKQVKYEFGDAKNKISVLKLNFTKKFYTGVYPYSMMTPVFTPVDLNNRSTLKITSSAQEWCGHTYMQLNSRADKFDIMLRSYFQDEGDRNIEIKKALLEDEVWTKIRLNPNSLPTGEIEIIPGFQFARLRHVPVKIEKAIATLSASGDEWQVYAIEYKSLKRKLSIKFEKNFPHRIVGWEESHPSGFGPNAKILTTKAVKTHSIRSDYWTKNKLSDSHMRDELGIIY